MGVPSGVGFVDCPTLDAFVRPSILFSPKLLFPFPSLTKKCSWSKYGEYNDWLREIQVFLQEYINPKITLIDAHSFVWLLDYLVKFRDQKVSYLKYHYKNKKDKSFRWRSCFITDIDDKYVKIKVENDNELKTFARTALYDAKLFRFYKMDIYTGKIFFDRVVRESQRINDELDAQLSIEIGDGELPSGDEVAYKPGAVPPGQEMCSPNGQKYYRRDPQISKNALALARYRCEYDESHKTFKRKSSDLNYTEAHHLVPMAYQNYFEKASLDREQNIISLCSHCHNLIHYGKGADELVRDLYFRRKDLLESVGIYISEGQLISLYK